MNIFPAIDLKNGQCVRLYQGQFDQLTAYTLDPIKQALEFAAAGAKHLHIVDLDGAINHSKNNLPLILQIAQQTQLFIQIEHSPT